MPDKLYYQPPHKFFVVCLLKTIFRNLGFIWKTGNNKGFCSINLTCLDNIFLKLSVQKILKSEAIPLFYNFVWGYSSFVIIL
jgi:hypothetical protein